MKSIGESNRIKVTFKFLEFEIENNLLSKEFNKLFIWQSARVRLFFKILNTGKNKESFKKDIFRLFKNFSRFFVNCIIFNPFFDYRREEVLIFESGRKYFNGNIYIDIYTHYFAKSLIDKGVSFKIYETNPTKLSSSINRNITRHIDFLRVLIRFVSLFYQPNFNKNEKRIILDINIQIIEKFGIDLDLLTVFNSEFKKIKSEFFIYNLFFKFKRPKEVFIINNTDKAGFILAAKRNNIIVNELQHGFNSNKDLINNYPYTQKNSLLYFPDNFYLWDNINMFYADLPITSDHIKYFPNEHINQMILATKSFEKEKKSILVISQPFESENIFDFILKNALMMKDYIFYYKLHPIENTNLFNKYSNIENIIFYKNELSIYELMKKSTFVIGVYSSSLFEAILFGCKVFVLNIDGAKLVEPLINSGNATILDEDSDLNLVFKFFKNEN